VEIDRTPFRLVHPEDPSRVIRGRIDRPSDARSRLRGPHAVLLHGFKGFMDWGFFPAMAVRLASAGIAAVRFNVSGSGIGEDLETFGEPEAFERNTLGREIEDLERVLGWIREEGSLGMDPARAVLIGHSRGAGLGLIHAAESRAFRGVVAWSSVATFDRFDDETKALWRLQGYVPVLNARTGQAFRLGRTALEDLERHRDRYDIPAACRRIGSPVLLVHGTEDETVPIRESELLLRSLGESRGRLLRIPGAGHTFGIRHPMTSSTPEWEQVATATLERALAWLG
jgi:pimeloyl-ACP methyl ester carboxylesterase